MSRLKAKPRQNGTVPSATGVGVARAFISGMINADYSVREKNGLRYVTPSLSEIRQERHSHVSDLLLILGFLAATAGLVFLLVK